MLKRIYIKGGLPEDLERVAKVWGRNWYSDFYIEDSGTPILSLTRGFPSSSFSEAQVLDRLNYLFLVYGSKLQLSLEGGDFDVYRLVDL
jgi:hypothetical protein